MQENIKILAAYAEDEKVKQQMGPWLKATLNKINITVWRQKKNQKFFKISQRVLVAQRSCEFQNILKYRKFFLRNFLKLRNFFKGAPASDFRLSTLKKGPKNAPMTSKLIF